jgi:hypothetical protein
MPRTAFSRLASLLTLAGGLAACEARLDPGAEARLQSHDAVLKELPRDFYRPGLGDLMQTLQVRHAKLWFAGAAHNWELAAFEMEEIRENLDRVARWHADSAELPMAPSLKAYMHQGRYALEQSIAQRDAARFAPAFDRFTQGCNDCHRAAKHGFIVIERPAAPPYTNQRWKPPEVSDGLSAGLR